MVSCLPCLTVVVVVIVGVQFARMQSLPAGHCWTVSFLPSLHHTFWLLLYFLYVQPMWLVHKINILFTARHGFFGVDASRKYHQRPQICQWNDTHRVTVSLTHSHRYTGFKALCWLYSFAFYLLDTQRPGQFEFEWAFVWYCMLRPGAGFICCFSLLFSFPTPWGGGGGLVQLSQVDSIISVIVYTPNAS